MQRKTILRVILAFVLVLSITVPNVSVSAASKADWTLIDWGTDESDSSEDTSVAHWDLSDLKWSTSSKSKKAEGDSKLKQTLQNQLDKLSKLAAKIKQPETKAKVKKLLKQAAAKIKKGTKAALKKATALLKKASKAISDYNKKSRQNVLDFANGKNPYL